MNYFGGKARLGASIAKRLHRLRRGRPYLEPFVGGGWVAQHIREGERRLGDANPDIIALYKAIQNGWDPPCEVDEDLYQRAKRGEVLPELRGFIGASCSFGGKWFQGIARDPSGKRNHARESRKSLLKKAHVGCFASALFECCSYDAWDPAGCLVYCDPPYADAAPGYFNKTWDADRFWSVMREWAKVATVVVSEYRAPEDFKVIAEWGVQVSCDGVNNTRAVEKLFYAGPHL